MSEVVTLTRLDLLNDRLATFESTLPRGPANAPLFCSTVMSRGGMMSVGLMSFHEFDIQS
jgi:hypothetical protein